MTPEQYRMACAALRLSFLDVGEEVGLSRSDLADFARDEEHAISDEGLAKLESWFNSRQVFFGPRHGVCLGQDVFAAERKQSLALFQLLNEAGITPSSADLIAAGRRAADPAAEAAELRGLLTSLVNHFLQDADCGESAPGHAHSVPGVWDSSNHPDKAGKPCAWCALWARAKAAVGAVDRKPEPVSAVITVGTITGWESLTVTPLCSDIEPGKTLNAAAQPSQEKEGGVQ